MQIRKELIATSLSLCPLLTLLVLTPELRAQPATQNLWGHQIRSLQILVLEGGRAESYPASPGVAPVIEVRDDVDRPVEGAEVIFDLPMTGPGGTFQGGGRSFTTKTNAQGQATPVSFTTGRETGPFYIRVSVRYRGLSAQTSIIQAVAVRPRSSEVILRPRHSARKWVILGIVAGAGGGGVAYALTRGASHPIKINLGGSTFTQP